MQAESNTPETLQEAIKYFAVYQNAHDFLVQIRWHGKACCPNCGSERVRYISTRRQWECRESHPKRRFSLKTGTIMEDSPLPLEKWLAALWLEVNSKNSISSWEVHRAIGVTQKTAWFMLHRLRHALQTGSFEKVGGNGGTVECDETFIGGLSKNMHLKERRRKITGSGASGKTAVMGILERHTEKGKSKVRAKVIENTKRKTLHDEIVKNVEPGTNVYTDSWPGYFGMPAEYAHDFVDHVEAYVKGAVHTNGLENFWSLFKRCIKGTHVSIEPHHLPAYIDSEAFRFNNRDTNDAGRFMRAAGGIDGKRLTFKMLTGKESEGDTASVAK